MLYLELWLVFLLIALVRDTSLIFVLYKEEQLQSVFFNESIFHIVSMGYLWVIYGLSMGYPMGYPMEWMKYNFFMILLWRFLASKNEVISRAQVSN